MSAQPESFFEGLDDAEDVPQPETPAPEPVAEPEKASAPEGAKAEEKPATKEPEKAAEKSAEKPAEPASREAPSAEKPVIAAPEAKAPETPDPRNWVPVGAHIELRNQLKAMQEENARLRNPPQPEKPAAAPPPPVDFVQDPKGYVDQKLGDVDQRVNAALSKLESGLKPVVEQTAQESAQTRFMTALTFNEQQFAAKQPDYFDALAHLRNLRASEIQMLNPAITQQELSNLMQQEELQLAANLMRSGRNPSEIAYNLAKARGYSPKAAEKPAAPVAETPKPADPPAKLIPEVKEPARLPPNLTLGTGTDAQVESEDPGDPFDVAWKEVFGRKRA